MDTIAITYRHVNKHTTPAMMLKTMHWFFELAEDKSEAKLIELTKKIGVAKVKQHLRCPLCLQDSFWRLYMELVRKYSKKCTGPNLIDSQKKI